jgi:hypothetical protein
MAISFISSASNLGNSITSFPTHQKNDLLLIFAYNDGATTAVTKPTEWVARTGLAVSSVGYLLVAYQVAQNSSTTSGTWTNADAVMAMVFRPGSDETISVNYLSTQQGSQATMIYTAQTAGTFETGADQALVGLISNRNTFAFSNTLLPPSGMTNAQYLTSTLFGIAGHYQLSRTTIWPTTNVVEANSAFYRTIVLSLTAVPYSMNKVSLTGTSNLIG